MPAWRHRAPTASVLLPSRDAPPPTCRPSAAPAQPRSAPLKRAAELGGLRGLRYAASLVLEGADLLLPLLRALLAAAAPAPADLAAAVELLADLLDQVG